MDRQERLGLMLKDLLNSKMRLEKCSTRDELFDVIASSWECVKDLIDVCENSLEYATKDMVENECNSDAQETVPEDQNVINAPEKGPLFCVRVISEDRWLKYPCMTADGEILKFEGGSVAGTFPKDDVEIFTRLF